MDRIRDIRGGRGEACGGYDRLRWWHNIRRHHLLILEEENQNRPETKQRAKLRRNKVRNSVQQAIITRAEDSVLLPLASPCITHARRGGIKAQLHCCISNISSFDMRQGTPHAAHGLVCLFTAAGYLLGRAAEPG